LKAKKKRLMRINQREEIPEKKYFRHIPRE
jgi:hypothetical protein